MDQLFCLKYYKDNFSVARAEQLIWIQQPYPTKLMKIVQTDAFRFSKWNGIKKQNKTQVSLWDSSYF